MKNLSKTLTLAVFCAFSAIACTKQSDGNASDGPPTITAFNPSGGADSTVVTIAGTGFGTDSTNVTVSFNGKQAALLSWSTTQIQVRVPTLAGSGPLTITANGHAADAGTFIYDTTWRVTPVIHNLGGPYSLTIDAGGTLYVGTVAPEEISKLSPQGSLTGFAQINTAFGSAFDAAGNLYVSSIVNADSSYIYKVDPAGNVSFFAADSGAIYGLAFDATTGSFYAANNSRNTVDKITAQGVSSVFARNLYLPSGITVTADGTVYVNNYSSPGYTPSNGVITRITNSGTASTLNAIGKYDATSGFTNDGTNIFLTVFDQGTAIGSIVKVTPSGNMSTLVTGNGIIEPDAITRDKSGNFYVSNLIDTVNGGITGSIVLLTPH